MNRKNGFLKRTKLRKNRMRNGGYATLTASRLLQGLKDAVRVAYPPTTVNIYSVL